MYTLIFKNTHTHTHTHNQIQLSKGAFTPDVNEALRANNLLVKSMQRRDRQSCGAIRANYTLRIERLGRLRDIRESRELKNLNFGGYSCRVNQSGACSSVITSGGRQSETTMEDKLIVVVCGYPELYDTTSYFYKNMNKFSNETGAACTEKKDLLDLLN